MANASTHSTLRYRVPTWARGFFTPGEYADFARLVCAEIARLGDALDVDLKRGRALVREPAEANGRVSLINLAHLCRPLPRAAWPQQIADFFGSLRRAYRRPDAVLERIARFDAMRTRVKVRLHPEDYLRHPDAPQLVLKKIAGGIAALLVCDLGYANVSVPRSVLKGWGKSPEELFRLAIANVRGEGRLLENRSVFPFGPPVDVLFSESNYAASHALFFEDYAKACTRYGALLGVPQRHVLVRHVIRDDTVIPAMQIMLRVIDDWHAEGPGPISRELYWWRPGKLERLRSRRRKGAVVITPTPELQAEVLDPVLRGN